MAFAHVTTITVKADGVGDSVPLPPGATPSAVTVAGVAKTYTIPQSNLLKLDAVPTAGQAIAITLDVTGIQPVPTVAS